MHTVVKFHILYKIYTMSKPCKFKVWRIYPGLDCFTVNGTYIPYLDVIIDSNKDQDVINAAKMVIPDLGDSKSNNQINYVEFLQYF